MAGEKLKGTAYQRWAVKNKKYLAAKTRRYRSTHPEVSRATSKKSRDKRKDKNRLLHRKWHLKTNYGLTVEQYAEMYAVQGGVCAVCRRPETILRRGKVKSLEVDHNHETGQIRELLCGACNPALGLLKEDPLRIRALADYIERHNAK